ncbi:hypothetical protein ACVWYN_003703 [Pedobacter sp. UYP24]
MDKIVVFETFYNPIEANIVKARLLDAGVQCFLTDENLVTINPLYTQALGGVKLHMFEGDILLAKDILMDEGFPIELNDSIADETFDSEKVDGIEKSITCPMCHSSNVGYVQATKNRFGILTMIVSIALAVYPFSVRKTHHCFTCENEF